MSLPPWKGSASRNNHDGWSARVTVARVAVRAQLTLLDAASLSQARRFRQKAPVKIPPHEASVNPWHVLSVKSPPNYEEQWKRSDSPKPSRFRHLGCTLTGCLGSNGRYLQGMTGRRSTQSEWSIGKVRQFCCLDQSLKQSSIVVGQYTLKGPRLAEQHRSKEARPVQDVEDHF